MSTLDQAMNYLADYVVDTGWKNNLSDKRANLTIWYRVKSGVCYITYQSAGGSAPTIPAKTWTSLGVLPSEARPSKIIYAPVNGRTGVVGELQISTAGLIQIYLSAATQITVGDIVFPVG